MITSVLIPVVVCLAAAGPAVPCWAQTEQTNGLPTATSCQREQIDRRYGLFMHFGINTFHDKEWTDGTLPASSYNPARIDADQWVCAARDAGMKYVLTIAKHHDGFCLWDSKYTDYDVASSSNKTDVVGAVARACRKRNMGFAIYYSLWDRHCNPQVKDESKDSEYNTYLLHQLEELLTQYGPVTELWLDGGWQKPNYRWDIPAIYALVKRLQPKCQVGVNWTIGLPENPDAHLITPAKQKEGFPFRYFPSDFRLGDPYLPICPDPKTFTHEGRRYYMPFETTVCLNRGWFYNTTDTKLKSVDELERLYYTATAQDNLLVLNAPPTREGRLRSADVKRLKELADRLGLKPGHPFPIEVSRNQPATASSVWQDDPAYAASKATDEDVTTRWAAGSSQAMLTVDLPAGTKFNRIVLHEFGPDGKYRVQKFHLEFMNNGAWKQLVAGTTMGVSKRLDFRTVTSSQVRIVIEAATESPSLCSFKVFLVR